MNTTIAPGGPPGAPSAEEIAAAVRILTAAWDPATTAPAADDENDADLGDDCGCGGNYDDAEDDPGSGILPKCTCAPGCSCDLCVQDDYDRAARCTAAITDPAGGYPRGCGKPSRLEVTAWQTSRITGLDPDHAAQCTKELHHACDRADVELGHRPHERQAGTACSMAHARQIGEQLPGYEQRAGGGGWHIRTYTHLPVLNGVRWPQGNGPSGPTPSNGQTTVHPVPGLPLLAGCACARTTYRPAGRTPGGANTTRRGGARTSRRRHLPYRSSLPAALNGLISHTELAKLAAHTVWERIARQHGAASTLGWARQHLASAVRCAAQLTAADLAPAADDDTGDGAQ